MATPLQSVTDRGLPFLTATRQGRIAGYAYCAPWQTRPAYRRTVEDSPCSFSDLCADPRQPSWSVISRQTGLSLRWSAVLRHSP